MEPIENLLSLNFDSNTAVAIGNFDGLHSGHQSLLNEFIHKSKSLNLKTIVITFFPHPAFYFNPDLEDYLLQDYESKERSIKELGVDYVFVCDFSESLQKLSAKNFITQYLLLIPKLKFVYLGHDFKLGNGKEDAFNIIKEETAKKKILFENFNALKIENEIVSSSLVRKLVKNDIEKANEKLGYNFSLEGEVISGQGIGKKELFPTLNLKVEKSLVKPSSGVYIGQVILGSNIYDSVINIGTNPTIGIDETLKIEAHLLHVNSIQPVTTAKFLFLKKIREESKFDTKKELKNQIKDDIDIALRFLRSTSDVKLALIGKNIQHSQSQYMYEKIFQKSVNYTLIDIENESELPSIEDLKKKYDGVSITAPYKQSYLNKGKILNSDFTSINTIIFKNPIELGNTDYLAAEEIICSYTQQGVDKFIVLGDGNMGKMIKIILENKQLDYVVYSRKSTGFTELYNSLNKYNSRTLIINTCAREFIFSPRESGSYFFWDLNYNREAQNSILDKYSIKYQDGIKMLERQAYFATKLWGFQ